MRPALPRALAALPLLALPWLGCRDLPPTASPPAPAAPSHDWTSEVEWHSVGSFDIPVPIGGAIPWTSTGITVNDTGWVRVQLTGGVTLQFNDRYKEMCVGPTSLQPPFCPLGQPLAGASLGPGGRRDFDDYMKVMVGIDRGNGPEFFDTGPFTESPGFYGGVVHGPGTIMVARYDPGWTIAGRSPFDVRGQEEIRVDVIGRAEPRMKCTDKDGRENVVTRGGTIVCRVVVDPDTTWQQATGWKFQGNNFAYPNLGAGDEPVAGTSWAGQMVMSGTISAEAAVNGRTSALRANIEVERRREWDTKSVPIVPQPVSYAELVKDGTTPLHVPPRAPEDLGRAHLETTYGFDFRGDPEGAARAIAIVTDYGPNHGLAYLKDVPVSVAIQVWVTEELTDHGSFWRAQAPVDLTVSGTRKCVRSAFAQYAELVKSHEGFDGNPHSHVGYYASAINPKAASAVEDIVVPSDQLALLNDVTVSRLTPILAAAKVRALAVDHDYPIHFGCEFTFDHNG